MTIDLTKLTYRQMADVISAVGAEIKHRNPIFVNAYLEPLRQSVAAVMEIADGEARNFTSEHGPREPKPVKPRKNCRHCHGEGFTKVASRVFNCSCVLPRGSRS